MIVTADPVGDFNATSQILRYSALAREITVPRIPSVTSTILAQSTASHYFSPRDRTGRMSPSDTERETMEIAALEIARMSEEIDGLRAELLAEQQRRLEAEAHLESMTDRILEVEAEVREECYAEMETQMESEMRRWKATWAAEADRNDEHLDRKLEIYTRSLDASEDKENKSPRKGGGKSANVENGGDRERDGDAEGERLEEENQRLRREIEILRREQGLRSPSKAQRTQREPLREAGFGRGDMGEGERMRVSGLGDRDGERGVEKSPVKKMKKLAPRKWDLMGEGELL